MLGIKRTLIVGLALAGPVLWGCAAASDMQLTAAEIKARIIGNTVAGVEDGKPYQEYYKADGTILGNDGSAPYTGMWRIDGNRLCMAYPSDDDSGKFGEWTCSNVGLVGDRVIWNEDGDLTEGKLLPGQN